MKKFLSFVLLVLNFTLIQSQNKIAVTIDDLPLSRIPYYEKSYYQNVTDKLIENLKNQKVPVIGFVNEYKLYTDSTLDKSKVDQLQKWIDAGFELGNHTFSHRSANSIPVEEYKQDIIKGEQITKELLNADGKKMRYFRHPFLHTGLSLEVKNDIEKFLNENGYKTAPVTVDNSEWAFSFAYDKAFNNKDSVLMKKIAEDYINYMRDKLEYWEEQSTALFGRNISHVLLIHANPLNADYYDDLCAMIRERNYEFVTLDEALEDEAYQSEDRFIKNNGISWIHRWAITKGKKKDFFGNEPEVPEYIMDFTGLKYE
ncbi:MAG: polysaccharide deacetylase family protein [Ignavibacteriales bacterium]|nr:polysaccharide deacetylase family protein [Ignavibacteriales bacterium]